MHTAFGISEEDIENVLRANSLRLEAQSGEPLDLLAEQIFGGFSDDDLARIERVALKASTDLDEQTSAACEEITRLLERDGWLKPRHIQAPSH